MDKSCSSSGEESGVMNPPNLNATSLESGRKDDYLKHLHKLSHKISKPPIRKPFDHLLHQPPLISDDKQNQCQPSDMHQQQQLQQQPPVYNINKSDFRDVVQKLTGSPAHERGSTPAQPVHPQSKPQSSRLQRIRPPPLEHVSNRPPPLLNDAVAGLLPRNPSFRPPASVSGNFFSGQRQQNQPLSPLPPFPAVHAAAESPISAYMRCFQTNTTGISGPSPRWNNFTQLPPPQPPPLDTVPPRSPPLNFPAPSSPLPFGCLPSPKSHNAMLSPGFPFSPSNSFGFQQFTPLSPTLPVSSPRWKAL